MRENVERVGPVKQHVLLWVKPDAFPPFTWLRVSFLEKGVLCYCLKSVWFSSLRIIPCARFKEKPFAECVCVFVCMLQASRAPISIPRQLRQRFVVLFAVKVARSQKQTLWRPFEETLGAITVLSNIVMVVPTCSSGSNFDGLSF